MFRTELDSRQKKRVHHGTKSFLRRRPRTLPVARLEPLMGRYAPDLPQQVRSAAIWSHPDGLPHPARAVLENRPGTGGPDVSASSSRSSDDPPLPSRAHRARSGWRWCSYRMPRAPRARCRPAQRARAFRDTRGMERRWGLVVSGRRPSRPAWPEEKISLTSMTSPFVPSRRRASAMFVRSLTILGPGRQVAEFAAAEPGLAVPNLPFGPELHVDELQRPCPARARTLEGDARVAKPGPPPLLSGAPTQNP